MHRFALTAMVCGMVFIFAPTAHAQNETVITVEPLTINHADATQEGSIAAALEDIHKAGGGEVRLQKGNYRVDESVVIHDNTRIIGEGKETVIRLSKKGNDHIINNTYSDDVNSPGVQNVMIRNLRLLGRRAVRKNCLQIVADNGARSAYIGVVNVWVENCGRHGVHIKGANNVKVRNAFFRKNGENIYHDHNLYLLRVTGAVVDSINTAQANGNGFSSTLLHDARLSRMYSFANGNRGFRFGAGRNIILRSCLSQQNSQLSEYQADGLTITSDDYHNTSSNIAIRGCRIVGNEGSGIAVDWATGVHIHDSEITQNDQCGIVDTRSDVLIHTVTLSENGRKHKKQAKCINE